MNAVSKDNGPVVGFKWTTIEFKCPFCGEVTRFTLATTEYIKYLEGREQRKLIQDIFPDWSMEDRELFISGICYKCQSSSFGY